MTRSFRFRPDCLWTFHGVLALPSRLWSGVFCIVAWWALGAAEPALAGKVFVIDRTLVVVAAPGQGNTVEISRTSKAVFVTDEIVNGIDRDARTRSSRRLVAGTRCTTGRRGQVRCPASEITRVRVYAGDEDDSVALNDVSWPSLISGGSGVDRLEGGSGADLVLGGAGHDVIGGGIGADRVRGGDGDDVIAGGDGDDRLAGETGADELVGGANRDVVDGGPGADSTSYAGHLAAVSVSLDDKANDGGALENDNIRSNVETVRGGHGNDVLIGPSSPVPDIAGLPAVHLLGGPGGDRLVGGPGSDLLDGGTGNDDLDGRAGDDHLYGGDGSDALHGGDGDDALYGSGGSDALYGGDGNDRMHVTAGGHQLECGAGYDPVYRGDAVGNSVAEDCELVEYFSRVGPSSSGALSRRHSIKARIAHPVGRARYVLVLVKTALGRQDARQLGRVQLRVRFYDENGRKIASVRRRARVNEWVRLRDLRVPRAARRVRASLTGS